MVKTLFTKEIFCIILEMTMYFFPIIVPITLAPHGPVERILKKSFEIDFFFQF